MRTELRNKQGEGEAPAERALAQLARRLAVPDVSKRPVGNIGAFRVDIAAMPQHY